MAPFEDQAEEAYRQGLRCGAAGRLEEAREWFDRAASLQPKDESGRTASNLVSDAIACNIGVDALGHFLRGAELAQNRSALAIEEIKLGLQLAPTYAPGFQALGFVQGLFGRFAESETSFRRAVELSPDTPEPHFNLGRFYHLRGQPTLAEQHYRDALNIDANFLPAQRYLAQLGNRSDGGRAAGDCFIATAAFESPMSPEVIVLKCWRDTTLTQSKLGRGFIGLYYAASPTIAGWVRRNSLVRQVAKGVLTYFSRRLG
jgi:tetratricopeptide (TPR) repeat protein